MCLHLIERRSIERLCGAHAEGAIVRNLVVLIEVVVGVNIIVGGCGNGVTSSCGHSKKLVRGMFEERRETQVGGVT
jgi:anaerobic glycerol-3-phosphate dehydrogenase